MINNCTKCNYSWEFNTHVNFLIPLYKSLKDIDDLIIFLKNFENKIKSKVKLTLVSDGETREDLILIENKVQKNFSLTKIELTRNFGVSAAIHAGLNNSNACFTVVCGSDLQEPIELYEEFIDLMLKSNYQLVIGAREYRKEKGFIYFFSKIYWILYKSFISPIAPLGGFDVFAVTESAKKLIKILKEEHTFILPQLDWLGIEKKYVFFTREKRKNGRSSWSIMQKVKLFFNIFLNFGNLFYKIIQYNFILLTTGLIGIYLFKKVDVLFNIFIIFSFIQVISILFVNSILLLNINSKINNRPTYVIKNITKFNL